MNKLRVIGGLFRGRPLQSVGGRGTRPLLGQVREALFSILGQDRVEGAEVWDLFAGTGANGIEALSRGARRVVFVEKSAQALRVLRGNVDDLGSDAKASAHVLRGDAWDPPVLSLEGEEVEVPPDLIFLDPPYAMAEEDPTRCAAGAERLLARAAPGATLCFHFPDGCLHEDDFAPGHDVELRSWNRAAIALIRRGDDGSDASSHAVE